MKTTVSLFFVGVLLISVNFSCKQDSLITEYKTRNVVIVVMDGPRYSETWGDSTHANIPFLAGKMAPHGVTYTRFFNNGPTYTLAGHTCLTTGHYQEINNSGKEYPQYPGIFHFWNQANPGQQNLTWVITSKDKLDVLANCQDPGYKDRYMPTDNCGIEGLGGGIGYRDDSLTCSVALEIFKEYHPRMVLINFAEPDNSGHEGIWENYIAAIRKTDQYVYRIWEYLQTDTFYKDNTAFFYTNDHGRHLDGVLDGFINHGDTCEGCRHINLFVSGPDFKRDVVLGTKRELIDIPATVAAIMGFRMPHGKGEVMQELFEDKK